MAHKQSHQILPSLLSADILNLEEEVSCLIAAGIDAIHLDVMDNHYVPNLSFSAKHCQALRQKFPTTLIDVHLMAQPVDDLILQFAAAGASRISIHPEASLHLDRSLQLIQDHGCKAGLVINPSTSLDCLTWVAHRLDFILIMTVNPGFAGQRLIPEVIEKISSCHQQYPTIAICVDGGVGCDNIHQLAVAGACEFVAGSAIFEDKNYNKTILNLRKRLPMNTI